MMPVLLVMIATTTITEQIPRALEIGLHASLFPSQA